MKRVKGEIVSAATDLANYMGCKHAVLLDLARQNLAGGDTGILMLPLCHELPVISTPSPELRAGYTQKARRTVISTGAPKVRNGEISTAKSLSPLHKTYTSAHVILAAIAAGQRFGVTGPKTCQRKLINKGEVTVAHSVNFSVPKRPLGKADIEFDIKDDGKMLGTLKVSKGALVWFPSYTTYGLKMSWARFDKLMKDSATRQEKR